MCFNIFNSFIFNISVILILFLPEEIVRVLINTFNSDQSLHLLTSLIFIYAIATMFVRTLRSWLEGVYLY